jgi:hypothetical protein
MSRITVSLLVLIFILITHLIEEIKTGFRKRFPLGEMSLSMFLGINISLYTYCFTTLLFSALKHPLAIPFAWVFGIAMALNGIGHIAIMILKRQYFPGGITSFPLLLTASYELDILHAR